MPVNLNKFSPFLCVQLHLIKNTFNVRTHNCLVASSYFKIPLLTRIGLAPGSQKGELWRTTLWSLTIGSSPETSSKKGSVTSLSWSGFCNWRITRSGTFLENPTRHTEGQDSWPENDVKASYAKTPIEYLCGNGLITEVKWKINISYACHVSDLWSCRSEITSTTNKDSPCI